MESFETASHIADDYRPEVFDGDLVFFTAGKDHSDHDVLANGWRLYVTGEIHNRVVDAHHLELSHPDALSEVGPTIERVMSEW